MEDAGESFPLETVSLRPASDAAHGHESEIGVSPLSSIHPAHGADGADGADGAGEHGEVEIFRGRSNESTSSTLYPKNIAQTATPDPPSTRLYHSKIILVLVLFYAALAVIPWVITVILTFRPITTNRYGASASDSVGDGLHLQILVSERWYHAMRIIQAVAAVLTIPVASAVCANAAVVFVQRKTKGTPLSIRQVMVLADRGWADPKTYAICLTAWDRYGSRFLLLAMLLNILGVMIYPLQQGFLSSQTIKTVVFPQQVFNLLDIPNQWPKYPIDPDSDLIVVLTRKALATSSYFDQQGQLWPGAGETCNALDHPSLNSPSYCSEGMTFSSMFDDGTNVQDPFLAELPSGFNTGLIQQFMPRINSTATYESISESDYPVACSQLPSGSFFVQYSNTTTATNDSCASSWDIQACMPANMTESPWKSTRNRQDFSEELYLNITISGCDDTFWGLGGNITLYRVTVNTTAGYFELPNYMNNGQAGPLLENDPTDLCGSDCDGQGLGDIYDDNASRRRTRRQAISEETNSTISLEGVFNKGPLLTTALALFGDGSFLAERVAFPQAYYGVDATVQSDGTVSWPANADSCNDIAPLGWLIPDLSDDTAAIGYCITNAAGGPEGIDLNDYLASWITTFQLDTTLLSNAFTSAAFLANQAWLMRNVGPDQGQGQRTLTVNYDLGADTVVPTISRAGIIVVSVVLGLFVIGLFALAVYSALTPKWTARFDAFAMMRIGAAMADEVPLLVLRELDRIAVLDKLPGRVGDTTEGDELIGHLGLGAPNVISGKKRYACYPGDVDQITAQERTRLS